MVQIHSPRPLFYSSLKLVREVLMAGGIPDEPGVGDVRESLEGAAFLGGMERTSANGSSSDLIIYLEFAMVILLGRIPTS